MAQRILLLLMTLALLVCASPSAQAQFVQGGGGEAVCQLLQGPLVKLQDGGLFPIGPASCGLTGLADGSIAVQPEVRLSGSAIASGLAPGEAASVHLELQYTFTLTGGNVGDLVPVLVHTHMASFVSPSNNPDFSNLVSTSVGLYGLSAVGGGVVSNGPRLDDCAASPSVPGCSGERDEFLSFNMASGSAELVYMTLTAGATSDIAGQASGQIDPYIFVDPHFANAGSYKINVLDAVANGPVTAVPEPGEAILMLAGLVVVGAVGARRTRAGAVEVFPEGGSRVPG
jgi:hypothetical protein